MVLLVSKAVKEVITLPKLGLIIERAEVVETDPEPNKTSVIIKNTFFLFKLLYFLL